MASKIRHKPKPRTRPIPSCPRAAVISDVAAFVPEDVLTNHDVALAADPSRLAAFIDEGPWFAAGRARALGLSPTLDPTVRNQKLFEAFIEERVGIRERRVIDRGAILDRRSSLRGIHASDLGAEAARRVLDSSALDAGAIDLVICCTTSPDALMPSTASRIQEKIGAGRAGGFDLVAACSGFAYGLQVASAMVSSGQVGTVLVVAAEYFTAGIDYADPRGSYFWGDGAAAAIVQTDGGTGGRTGWRVRATRSRSHPSLNVRSGMGGTLASAAQAVAASAEPGDPAYPYFWQNGRRVYRDVAPMVSQTIHSLLADEGLEISELDDIVLHQASGVMVDAIARQLGISAGAPHPRVVRNYERFGNTCSCGAAIALAECSNAQPGDRALLCAFGAGYTLAVLLLERQ